jgi:hypothetical protein
MDPDYIHSISIPSIEKFERFKKFHFIEKKCKSEISIEKFNCTTNFWTIS